MIGWIVRGSGQQGGGKWTIVHKRALQSALLPRFPMAPVR